MTPTEMLKGPAELVRSCDEAAWNDLIRFLLGAITGWLGYEVTAESIEQACAGDGFCIDILHASPSGDDHFHWKGILGGSLVEGKLRVSLLMFMYSGNERLVTKSGREFAEYVYLINESHGGRWELNGWFDDQYGEYDQF